MTKTKTKIGIALLSIVALSSLITASILPRNNANAQSNVVLNKWQTGNDSSAVYEQHKDSSSNGLTVRLAENDTLEFNQIIDISQLTKADTLVDFFVTPNTIGGTDFERLYFTFTDVENEEITLTLEAKASPDGYKAINYPWTYVYAAGNGQKLRSYTSWAGLNTDDGYGLGVVHSFWGYYGDSGDDVTSQLVNFGTTNKGETNSYGLDGTTKLDTVHTSFSFDPADNEVYVNGSISVFDLDDIALSDTVWNGFESGKVRLSVRASSYNGATANFVIKSIYGIDFAESTFNDTASPQISVDLPSDNALETYIGYDFTIPYAEVKDDYDKNCQLDISVWYKYTSLNPVAVSINNGKFSSASIGYYTIVYTSQDESGNIAKEEVFVYSKPAEELSVLLTDGYLTETVVGNDVNIADYKVKGAASGIYDLEISAKLGNENIVIKDGKFVPQKVGQYNIEYKVTDYFGRTSVKTYTLTVGKANAPVLKDSYDFPQALVSGIRYKIPAYSAYDYTSGSLVMKKMPLYIKDVNGERLADNDTFTPIVANSGDKVTLSFKDGDLELKKDIPVIVPEIDGKLHMENYFLADGINATALNNGINISAEKPDGGWVFANPLITDNLSFALRAEPNKSTFSALKIKLSDSEKSSQSITMVLRYSEGKTYLEVCGNRVTLNCGFAANSDVNRHNIDFEVNGNRLTVGESNIRLTTIDDGEQFTSFASGKVYLSVQFVDATNSASYYVTSINGQTVSSSGNDRTRPKISILGKYDVCILPGNTITIPRAVAGDVLNGIAHFYLTVKDANGNFAESKDGVTLNKVSADRVYEIDAQSFGQYIVSYTAADTANGNDLIRMFAVTVEDNVAPEIKLGKTVSKAKTGDVILVPVLDYSDNLTAKDDLVLFITVYTPDGTIIALGQDSNSFIAVQKGLYEVRISVYDKSGNVGYETFKVTVE